MSAINPIRGPQPPHAGAAGASGSRGSTSQPAGAGNAAGEGFAPSLREFVENVNAGQQRSAEAIQDLVSGRTRDVVGVVAEVAEADLSFKLLIGIRNQIIEAYKQTMNMQI